MKLNKKSENIDRKFVISANDVLSYMLISSPDLWERNKKVALSTGCVRSQHGFPRKPSFRKLQEITLSTSARQYTRVYELKNLLLRWTFQKPCLGGGKGPIKGISTSWFMKTITKSSAPGCSRNRTSKLEEICLVCGEARVMRWYTSYWVLAKAANGQTSRSTEIFHICRATASS